MSNRVGIGCFKRSEYMTFPNNCHSKKFHKKVSSLKVLSSAGPGYAPECGEENQHALAPVDTFSLRRDEPVRGRALERAVDEPNRKVPDRHSRSPLVAISRNPSLS